MIIQINLNEKDIATFGEQKILLPEEVFLHFVSTNYSLGTLIVTVKNGNAQKQYKTSGEAINITSLCKNAGELNIEVSYVIKCETVKSWRVEPILLCEVKHGVEAIPEFEVLKTEIEKNRAAIRDIARLIKENDFI